ncbi:hypothetical protein Egran_05220 [Elaphomyces granulatus]|uniref:Ribosomal protein s17 n=1 Tax=Elaphomyces granulatus TaxID=519963 RepID=A0A232LS77_9EURO|nr:hypothetical protein Egran_05220 [Elaphomyces granulatus]
MLPKHLFFAVVLKLALANNNNNNNKLALNPNNVQTGSQSDGLGNGAQPGQTASATDDANFINFCEGKTLTNGLQQKGGSCNGIVMGDIPSTNNMISTIIKSPQSGQDLQANQAFTVDLQVQNLVAGSFTNADSTYYAAPQALKNGNIVGHTHVTIQSLGNDINTQTPPDPTTFTFFKGINDPGDGNGGLSASVASGLPAGVYRVCTMTSASNHQPVLMPVAQRGAQDDCTKFTVGQGSGNNNNAVASGTANPANPSSTSSSPQNTPAVNSKHGNKNNQGGQGRRGRGGGGRLKGRFATRPFIA